MSDTRRTRTKAATPLSQMPFSTAEMLQTLVDSLTDYAIVLVSPEGQVLSWSPAAERLKGWKADEIIGQSFARFYTEEDVQSGKPGRELADAERDGRFEDEGWRVQKDGTRFWANVVITPLRDGQGQVRAFGKVTRDLTERKRQEHVIQRQAQEILEMIPIVQVWEGVVLTPLIGTLDSQRTQELMERLLHRVAATGSRVAIIDITGVTTVDTQTAQHLIDTITAVRLLGAEAILTGVGPVIAQTLVHLGIDLSNVLTRSALSAGLRVALDLIDLGVLPKDQTA